MNTTKHTPGPWVVKDRDTVVGPQGNVVAECCGYSVQATDKDQVRQGGREANAHLIAAAPAMYEALKYLVHLIGEENVPGDILATIAQAEGK